MSGIGRLQRSTCLLLVTLFILTALPVFAQAAAAPDRMQWWRDARFGMFIHWGPVSIKGTEIGWSRGGERRGVGGTGEIPVEVYDNLYKEFNPTEFDAREWVAIAKRAGMKYLVFTTRHHDGFSMFDSAYSDYKITNSPFKRDVVAELAEACHQAGLRLGFYYSPPDWHNADYKTENHAKYIEYLHNQVRELCTKYGKVDIFWFDGLNGTTKDWDSERLIKMIRELQPGIVINNRAALPEDLDTPEQTVGAFQRGRPWETCMTIGDQWAWKPNDRVKSLKQCLDVLIKCAGGDGNLLFNVGPMPNGQIEARQISRLAEMGAWMERYGETIYGTRGGPFRPTAWGASTCKDNTIYVHILDWKSAPEKLMLPPLKAKVVKCALLTGGEATYKQTRKGIQLTIPTTARQEIDTIVALTLNSSAVDIEPVAMPSETTPKGAVARASNVHGNDPQYAAQKAFDGEQNTRWATNGGTHQAWIEVEFKKPVKIGRAKISEACGDRIRKFTLEQKVGEEWKPFFTGTNVGEHFSVKFPTVKTRQLRLNIQEATEGPTIYEIQFLPPEKK